MVRSCSPSRATPWCSGTRPAPLAKRLNESRNVEIIREALKDALGVDWNVRCDVGTPAVPVTAGPPTDRAVPPLPAPPDDEEASMMAEAAEVDAAAPRRDPEEVALELLQNELGARKIEG